MVRAPCCQKVGMKRGPWSPEEDQILVDYIRRYGHANWRALPRQAGLLRCGKSCRLRWTNYLRPDIKRGNFTKEEEDMIISLHEKLGNKWSAIAAMIPGRTDNEIKNVWHTHLKKRECPREAERTSKKKKKKAAMVTARDAINSQQQPSPPPPPLDYCSAKDGDDALPSVSTPFSSYPAPGSSDNMGGGEEGSLSEGIEESFWSEALWAGAEPTQSIDDIGSVPENSSDLEFWLSMFRDAESMVDLQVVQGLNLDESYVRVHF